MQQSSEPIASLKGVDFAYEGRRLVLEDVNLEIGHQDFVAVIGPNGGGKTTLIKLMMGTLQPRRGQARLFGRPPAECRGRFGYVPQYSHLDNDFPVTVLEVVLLGCLGPGLSLGPFKKSDHQTAHGALQDVGCEAIAARSFAELSGGQRQRVLIARALASSPEILFLDEPSSNLDPSIQDEFYGLLHRLKERTAVVIVSHDVGFVSRHVERVVCVNRQVYLHSTSELKGDVLEHLYGDLGVRVVDHDHSHGHGSE